MSMVVTPVQTLYMPTFAIFLAHAVVITQGQMGHTYSSSNIIGCNFNTQTSSYTRNGENTQVISIKGCGINDHFEFKMPVSSGGISVYNNNSCIIIGDPNKDKFLIFSDKPSTLVIKTQGSCVKKTYTKDSHGHITSISSPMSDTECSETTQKAKLEIEKTRKYWEHWNQNFQQQMQQNFPPGFPFHHHQRNQYENAGVDSDFYSGPGTNINSNPDSSSFSNSWANWGANFGKKMKDTMKSFFPFNQ